MMPKSPQHFWGRPSPLHPPSGAGGNKLLARSQEISYLSCSLRRPHISEKAVNWSGNSGEGQREPSTMPSLMKADTQHPEAQLPYKYFPTIDKRLVQKLSLGF